MRRIAQDKGWVQVRDSGMGERKPCAEENNKHFAIDGRSILFLFRVVLKAGSSREIAFSTNAGRESEHAFFFAAIYVFCGWDKNPPI